MQHQDDRDALQKQYGFACECSKCTTAQEQSKKRPLDKSQHSDQIYLCVKEECRAPIILDVAMRFWWHTQDKANISCAACGYTFEMQWNSPSAISQMPIPVALLMYEDKTKMMAKVHAQKTDICRSLLSNMGNYQPIDCEINRRLLFVAEDFMAAEAEQYGKYSLEYLAACIYWLDLAALLQMESYQFDESLGSIVSKIAHISDVMEHVVSLDIRTIIQHYCGHILGQNNITET